MGCTTRQQMKIAPLGRHRHCLSLDFFDNNSYSPYTFREFRSAEWSASHMSDHVLRPHRLAVKAKCVFRNALVLTTCLYRSALALAYAMVYFALEPARSGH